MIDKVFAFNYDLGIMKYSNLLLLIVLILTCLCQSVSAKTALDPSVVGVGARSLSMGRVLAALDAKPDSIFLNPAALSSLTASGGTSMYTSLLNQVNYVQLGGVQPISDSSAFGLGFVSASITGIQSAVIDPVTGRLTFEAGTTDYYNNIYYLSFGQKIYEGLSAGIHLKAYSQGFSSGSTGTGYDADFGLTYDYNKNLRIGFVQANFIPASAGGKVVWQNGAEEALATSSRLGVQYTINDLGLNLDYKIFPMLSDETGQLKLGAEWWASPNVALRIGSDQDGGENSLTAGLGFLVSGTGFDYAYRSYGGEAATTTHVFSLSLGVPQVKGPEKKAAGLERGTYVQVLNPPDKSIVYTDTINVEGTVDPRVKKLRISALTVPLLDNSFGARRLLHLGKNPLLVQAFDEQGNKLEEELIRVLRLKKFTDVSETYWVAQPIAVLAMDKIISGYPDGTFRPAGTISRAEMCAVLMKIKGVMGEKQPTLFFDVPKKHWASGYISEAVKDGIVKGYPDGTFKPNGRITRAEGAVIIARFLNLPEPKLFEPPFPDVPGRHWAARQIMSAKEAGLLQYITGYFDLTKPLTRAEVVEMLSKSDLVRPKIDEMLDFEEGY